MGGATQQPFGPFSHCDSTPTLLGFMQVPSVRGIGDKGKSVDYGVSAWKGCLFSPSLGYAKSLRPRIWL